MLNNSKLMAYLKTKVKAALLADFELAHIETFIDKYCRRDHKIVDVGCGYGRLLKPLVQKGYSVVGVEKNEHIVNENQAKGLPCIDFDAFSKRQEKYHCIILSHIIEHFSPNELAAFLDFYLDRLEKGGYLLIATPLLSPYFYDDFDHVKPYLPTGILMVCGGQHAQVQYYAKNSLELIDLTFRVSPIRFGLFKGAFLKTKSTKWLQLMNLMMTGLYWLSGQCLGKKDGWIGVFQKKEVLNA